MDLECIKNGIECIKKNKWVTYEDSFPFYHPDILKLEENLYQSLCMDFICIENYSLIKNKEIETLTLTELYSYISYIFKNEQFVIGFIDQYCENGILLKLLERVIQWQN